MNEEYRLVNVIELIIDEYLENILRDPRIDVCRCDRCKLDIKAIALNQLKPMYAVTEKGEILIKTLKQEVQNVSEIQVAILKAVSMVSNRPKHNIEGIDHML